MIKEIASSKVFWFVWVFMLAFHAGYANGLDERKYDAGGTLLGTIRMEAGRLVERDPQGGMISYWVTRNGETRHYDPSGGLIGVNRP